MNSDVLLQTAAIFFLSNLYLKQGLLARCNRRNIALVADAALNSNLTN